MSILRVEDLETCYDKSPIFQNLNLDIQEGKITTIIGPNGCGKSTLLKTIGRILKQTNGKVYLQEKDLATIHTKEIAKHLALLPQHPTAPGQLKVEELISYGRYPHRKNVNKLTKQDQELINWAMDITNVSDFKNRQIANLSGGQRQKVWLAMALAQETDILLLDEPTTFLDMSHQLEVLQIVEELNVEKHCTVVMVLHDINHAARFSDEIIAMKQGKLINVGKPTEIITPETLKTVFEIEARVMVDPYTGAPVCFSYDSLSSKKPTLDMYVTN
ncbi:ABC transporter ATP-binding protein [Priestia flexa]|jgi:iron complex transport system ATP-binding protein|uniref:ABC transporter ATP-binding protein n=2 Tax=Priestia TaxID=2800373 RepID=A0A0V8JNG3_9BACI|nr:MULTISPECIES: ABC transporter ATP-binding protein [Bacillaceae]KSU88594.1 ABC transporter ATP-binding protein [Priestia veravalensis]KZB91942.1 ABC transporter ATP-binding protein [Bacillus sp. VT 712]MBN8251062.1 ABC transporter ATP-binding protein [Priestia flexa]MBN8433279.1 ABC transporter ATP-binding protein [Priestia flexa]MCA0965805.1 ABC transporter ATP-binding protein [Priestia flexa]